MPRHFEVPQTVSTASMSDARNSRRTEPSTKDVVTSGHSFSSQKVHHYIDESRPARRIQEKLRADARPQAQLFCRPVEAPLLLHCDKCPQYEILGFSHGGSR